MGERRVAIKELLQSNVKEKKIVVFQEKYLQVILVWDYDKWSRVFGFEIFDSGIFLGRKIWRVFSFGLDWFK